MKPKVSIITVVYNDVKNIEKTITNTLEQTYSNLEYVIVDGGSTDGTVDIIKKYSHSLIWKSEKDKGIYDAMYKGSIMATGEWILFRNSGDLFFNNHVIEDVFHDYIDTGEGLIMGNIRYLRNGWMKDMTPAYPQKHYFDAMPAHHPATFIRRSLQIKNPFPAQYRQSADYWFFIKVLREGVRFKHIDIIIALYDNTTGASTDRYDISLKENAEILHSFGAPIEKVEYRKKRAKRVAMINKLRKNFIFNFIYKYYFFYKVILKGDWEKCK